MDRLSRIVVLCSVLAAVALQTRLGSRDYGPLTLLVEAAFAMGVAGALVAPGAATAIVLVWAYVAPVAIGVSIGRYHSTFILIWIASALARSSSVAIEAVKRATRHAAIDVAHASTPTVVTSPHRRIPWPRKGFQQRQCHVYSSE